MSRMIVVVIDLDDRVQDESLASDLALQIARYGIKRHRGIVKPRRRTINVPAERVDEA